MAINNMVQVGIATKESYDDGTIIYTWDGGNIRVKGEDIAITRQAQNAKQPPLKSALKWGLITNTHSTANAEELVDYWHQHFFFGKAPTDYFVEISRGNIQGQEVWKALGERESIGTTVSGEDIWRGNELSPAPTSHLVIPTPADAGELMTVVSEDDEDGAGTLTGVLTINIHYLDPDGVEANVDVTLNGTTPVDIPVILMRFVNDMHSLTVGSVGVSVGHIKIYKTGTAGLVYNMIAEGGNKSMVPHRMVPVNKTLHLKEWMATEGNNKRAAVRIRSTDHHGTITTGAFQFKGVAYLNQSTSGQLTLNDIIPALSIVKVSVWATAINSECSTSWWGILIDD